MSNSKLWFLIVALASILGLSSCATQQKPLYSWYGYEDAAYQNSKKMTDKTEENFVKQINKVIEKQQGSRQTVPPGIFAEYGYFLVKKGQPQEGVEFLKKEISLYPESQTFISRIINQLDNNNETE